MKKCKMCNLELPIESFNKDNSKKDKLTSRCKGCYKLYYKNYSINNSDKLKEKLIKWRAKNPEKMKKINTEWHVKNKTIANENSKKWYRENKEYKLSLNKQWREDNREYIRIKQNEYIKTRKENDPMFKLKILITSSIRKSFKKNKFIKKSKYEDILGCTFQQFKEHLELQWDSWMTWENYGNPKDGIYEPNKTWDIDHNIPSSSALTEDELIKLNHYTNLKPLCSYYNRFIKRSNL